MLQAKTNTGHSVTLASLATTEIASIRKQPFFCPSCHEQVIVRAGPQTIPHFAHKSKSECLHGKGGESDYHEKGKYHLYQWLKNHGLQVELEHYLPSIQQRPDIFLTISAKQIAIEYQCARIPIQTIHKRIKGYYRLGITPIWILSAKLFKRLGKNRMKIDAFLRQFIHHFSADTIPVLYFLCPHTKHFLRFQHIHYNRPNQAIGRITMTPLERLRFPDIFAQQSYTTERLYHDWKLEKRYLRLHQKRHMHGRERDWYNWLYEKGTYKEYLPSIIHLPVQGQHLMKTPLWDWQSRICLEIIHPRGMEAVFAYSECRRLLSHHTNRTKHYPLLKIDIDPIKEYLNILVAEGTLRQLDNQYKKVKELSFYSSLEEAIGGDDVLMKRLWKNVSF